ncbi:MAG: glycerophosphodiester phosphodiesterase [Cryobacterium sp.]|uniref:glycerophosphodiester phosphodiesterase family protein n=1 Tax=unclassified Cryobacterium TaxID=2649013 RepID=UPI0018C99711|nr:MULTISPECIES: glycerophosphodiester phosphodiesterase family protein [unclassified Cryobacterium]MCY7403808.1 glycerophosphodiester phosphodiesterase [Cryobacterium sp.]MEC5154211.1 glycerophosphoryl diester phosphodiesterase [Cryobacterium sp. CAN_C3]
MRLRNILTITVVAALSVGAATVSAAPATAAPTTPTGTPLQADDSNGSFDLQSHRGGRGQWGEESITALAHSLELGVSTLELDTHLTRDDRIVVWHDDVMTASKCADTAPAFADDPQFPYANDRVRELTYAQIETMDCGYQQLPGFPEQVNTPGTRIALLTDVFGLVNAYKAAKVGLNVETKVEVAGPTGDAEMQALTRRVVAEIQQSGMAERTTVQSFDWASLNLTKQIAPELSLVALSSGDAWMGVGQPGISPNLGGIDIDDYNGSLAQAAAAQGYDVVSPTFASVTAQMVTEAHELGLPVIPWTVNTTSDITAIMNLGVDGIITDYPTRLRDVMTERGLKLPKSYTLR